jgi:N-acetylneuraminic acid mutarotase
VMGGRTGGMSANVDAAEVYDPINDRWTELPPMPSKRGGIASAAVNETIYVFGGEEPGRTFDNNEKYEPITNKWTVAQSMPTARHGLAAASTNDRIYVIGGEPEPGGSQTGLNEILHSAR